MVDPALPFAIGFCLLMGLGLMLHGLIVYHGWLLGSHPRVVQLRRRLYWHAIRAGWPFAWAMPGNLWYGVSMLLLGLGAWRLAIEQEDGLAAALALVGLVGMFVVLGLAWLRPPWFLAPWHRAGLKRERAGLPPAIPPPREGPTMTMTRRERTFGLVLAGLLILAWWAFSLSGVILIGVAAILGILGVVPTRKD